MVFITYTVLPNVPEQKVEAMRVQSFWVLSNPVINRQPAHENLSTSPFSTSHATHMPLLERNMKDLPET